MIHLLLSLIFLPLRIAGFAFTLLLIPVRIILKLFIRNLWMLAILVVIVVLYVAFQQSKPPRQLTPAPIQQQAAQPGQQRPIVIDPVMKREDGNSAFALDLYANMTELERAYYSQLFFHIMSTVKDGTTQTWANGNINGALTPTRSFQNNSGVTCRAFRETLKVHTVEQQLAGTACAQPNGAWCKLKLNATPSCGLGRKRGLMDGLKALF
jgi:hypothetical protein